MQLRTTKKHELPALLGLYQHLHATDFPLPDQESLHQVWNEILADPKIHSQHHKSELRVLIE